MHLLPADRSDHRVIDATVSQTLRYLRASQTVIAEREGRVVRYRLASTPITALLADRAGRPVAP